MSDRDATVKALRARYCWGTRWNTLSADACDDLIRAALDAGKAIGLAEGAAQERAACSDVCEAEAVRLERKDERGEIWKHGDKMAAGARHCALYIRMRSVSEAAHRMDALDGPVCRCGRPSAHESGWCGECTRPAASGGETADG